MPESEWQTRRDRIDKPPRALGWPLVDIISMVKHAANDRQPLLTPQERVVRAFDALTAGKTFTPAQQAWLDRIRAHLVENLAIDREDFEDLPVFTRYGGWARAD